jgi:hypothetical protein
LLLSAKSQRRLQQRRDLALVALDEPVVGVSS